MCLLKQVQDNKGHKEGVDLEEDRHQTKVVVDRGDFQDPTKTKGCVDHHLEAHRVALLDLVDHQVDFEEVSSLWNNATIVAD